MKGKLNVPNTLSLIRVILTFVFMITAIVFDLCGLPIWTRLIPTAIFGLAAFTDFLDGKIARAKHLITDFGKFIDPLADKFMVFGACITFLVIDPNTAPVFVWVSALVILRELAVTSMRLVVSSQSGIVIAASFFGKCKTVIQIVTLLVMFLEPVFAWLAGLVKLAPVATFFGHTPLSYVLMVAMGIVTIASGIDYLRAYMPHIDTNK